MIEATKLEATLEAVQWDGTHGGAVEISQWMEADRDLGIDELHFTSRLRGGSTIRLSVRDYSTELSAGEWIIRLPGRRYIVMTNSEFVGEFLTPQVIQVSEASMQEIRPVDV